ncbi:PorT family protein [Antarcticibacterium flavum]|uniref:PorT family protein n=1 Tax=Antarcticibacterium flavum TaxID=2058175 RepID=A0A5B7WZ88_9FLAO|nr:MULTISPECIES: porin family protein [Antarcticibacterium]MCM4161191.1 PorT family protein [Antarcticibacterium sp. W02-3]QCY68307.1 PorT family protein [Antarcticibacterium flavum]
MMIKRIFLIFTLCLLGLQLQAQEYFKVGLKGGVNISGFAGKDAIQGNFKDRSDIHLGILGEILVAPQFALQPEIIYSSQGARSSSHELAELRGREVTFKVDYISLPVMLKYFIVPGLSIEAGPRFSFLIDSKAEATGSENASTLDITNKTEKFDLGVAGGLGYELPLGIFVQARYLRGFSNIYEDVDYRNSLIQLSIGYKY